MTKVDMRHGRLGWLVLFLINVIVALIWASFMQAGLLDFLVGYGDATVFLHDNLYGIRDGVVDAVWPILGRGKLR